MRHLRDGDSRSEGPRNVRQAGVLFDPQVRRDAQGHEVRERSALDEGASAVAGRGQVR